MSEANIPTQSRTDVHYQEIKLFIEGIQVPFLSISITSSIGALPQATISIPPQVGILEITRFYNPKVHIFYVDPIDGAEKVLFSGVALNSSYSKDGGSSSVTFQCQHRYIFMNEFLMDFSGWTSELTNINAASEQAVKSPAMSSKYAIALAMTGILNDPALRGEYVEVTQAGVDADAKFLGIGLTPKCSPAILPSALKDFGNRMQGMPGVLLNMWNQLKHFAYKQPVENELMLKMYIPLIEDGLQFFKRLGGHTFIEQKIEQERIDPCPSTPNAEIHNKPRIVSPNLRVFLKSAVQAELGVELISSIMQFSGELADLLSIYIKFLLGIDYEMVFLASPAEVAQNPHFDDDGRLSDPSSSTYALDSIIKPQLPYYYSPICNVLYPNMIRSINLQQDDYGIPTRINIKNNELPGASGGPNTNYRAPASIREAIAGFAGTSKRAATDVGTSNGTPVSNPELVRTGTRDMNEVILDVKGNFVDNINQNLQSTLGSSHSKVGLYEQGRGVKFEKLIMPKWLSFYSASMFKDPEGSDGWPSANDTENYNAIQTLAEGWADRYGDGKATLNPWERASGLKAYQRLLVAAADYQYAQSVARSRAGNVESIFNPYIVPGYPMDIVDDTPNHPSFHAYCTSVTHTITSTSISTSISFVSAMTYTELANYYMPGSHPWLQVSLGLAKDQNIVQASQTLDSDAMVAAHKFYLPVLGVGATSPTQLYDFQTGSILPVRRLGPGLTGGVRESIRGGNGGELNPMASGLGSLSLAYREIEERDDIETRWSVSFVDLSEGNYNSSTIRVKNQKISDTTLLEPGSSQFLTYEPKFSDKSQDVTDDSETPPSLTDDNLVNNN
jgi:hypothetical protein